MEFHEEGGQGYLRNEEGQAAELIFAMDSRGEGELHAVDAGGRFLDLSQGLAPDKLTAETRRVKAWPADAAQPRAASLAWSASANGPWSDVWTFDEKTTWPDGMATPQKLQWPQVDRTISGLGNGAAPIYIRYRFQNIAVDDIRLATVSRPRGNTQAVQVTHCWTENGKAMHQSNLLSAFPAAYDVKTSSTASVHPVSLVLSAADPQKTECRPMRRYAIRPPPFMIGPKSQLISQRCN